MRGDCEVWREATRRRIQSKKNMWKIMSMKKRYMHMVVLLVIVLVVVMGAAVIYMQHIRQKELVNREKNDVGDKEEEEE